MAVHAYPRTFRLLTDDQCLLVAEWKRILRITNSELLLQKGISQTVRLKCFPRILETPNLGICVLCRATRIRLRLSTRVHLVEVSCIHRLRCGQQLSWSALTHHDSPNIVSDRAAAKPPKTKLTKIHKKKNRRKLNNAVCKVLLDFMLLLQARTWHSSSEMIWARQQRPTMELLVHRSKYTARLTYSSVV